MPDRDLPVFTIADLESAPTFDVASFAREDAIALGVIATEVIREWDADLAVRVVHGDAEVFVARFGTTGPGNDPWLAGKAAVAARFGEPSLLVRRRHEDAGTPFADRTDVDHDLLRPHGGAIPLFSGGILVGTITMSGEPDVVDHAASAEVLRRFLAR